MLQEHNKTFINQFKDTIFHDDNASETLRALADGPKRNVLTSKGYDINNYSFYTKSQDEKSTVQNSRVSIDAHAKHYCSASDNPIMVSIPYFGVIQQIWEVDYSHLRVPIFKCKWVHGKTSVSR